MRIKKTETGNEYKLTEQGIWVRNFTRNVVPIDINSITSKKDYSMMVENEVANDTVGMGELDTAMIEHPKCLIVSDGHKFEEKQHLLVSLPKDVTVIAVNRALAKWKTTRKIDYYVANNPYPECMGNLPKHRYFPKCVASSKTHSGFVKEYMRRGGIVYKYCPVPEKRFAPSQQKAICMIDDYRNPVCAAIGLAHRFKARRVMMFCCDDAFEGSRPGAEAAGGLWIYPQHRIVHGIIEASLGWLSGVKSASHSSGLEFEHAPYIQAEDITAFFEGQWDSKNGLSMKNGLLVGAD